MSFSSHLRAYRTQEARLVELRMTVLEYQGHCFKVNVPLADVIPGREGWDRGLTAVHNLLKPQCHLLWCKSSTMAMVSMDLGNLSPRSGRKTFPAPLPPIVTRVQMLSSVFASLLAVHYYFNGPP